MNSRFAPAALLGLCLAAWAPVAEAHIVTGEAMGLLSGFLHPISGLDHVLAMVSVGLWGAQLGAPAIWVLPVTFPLVMAMGGMLAFSACRSGPEIGIALSMVMLGGAVMLEAPCLPIIAGVVGFFAIFHGYAHGTELPAGQSALLYSLGFVVATGCLHLIGIAIGLIHRWGWGRGALRLGGSAVAIAGMAFLWSAVA
jgi:urease accessory protein